jgi:mycofactocin precursor
MQESTVSPAENSPEVDESDGQSLIEEESLIEEVSIDGMCGVY